MQFHLLLVSFQILVARQNSFVIYTLDGEWRTVTEENKAVFRFFKVVVEVP